MPTVAVDFDGVIHAYSKGWQDGSIYDKPELGAGEALSDLMSQYSVMVHTTRDPDQPARWIHREFGFPVTWFTNSLRHQIPSPDCRWASWAEAMPEFWNEKGVILVTQRKLPAIAYIDDRAIRFINWNQAMADLASIG